MEVGLRNLGPTTMIPYSPDYSWLPSVQVTIPTGVKLTGVDIDCVPGTDPTDWDFEYAGTVDGRVYTCFSQEEGVRVGEKLAFSFTGKLTGEKSTAGSIVVDGGVQDTNAKNDKAAITVSLKGDSGGQGAGLPITGAPTGWVALGGAALLVAGGVAAFVFRRRRVITTL